MKQAAGEANMTVIVVVLIGVVAAVGLLVIPKVMKRVNFRSCCNMVGGRLVRCSSGTGRCCRYDEGESSAFASCISSYN